MTNQTQSQSPGSTSTGSGFADMKAKAISSLYDWESAIPIEQVDYELVELGYFWEQGELPPLPVGFFITDKETGNKEKLTTYTFKEDALKSAASELFLEKAEERIRDAKGTVNKLTSFLAKTIDTIGGYPLQQIVERYGNSAEIMFQRAWLADIFTMYLGARLTVIGDQLAIANQQCPCPRKEVIYDDPENNRPLHTLREIHIKYFLGVDDQMPLFKLELPVGFSDGQSTIKNLYCVPLRLNDLSAIADSKGQDTTKHKTFQRMIVGMPESDIFGIRRGSVFSEDVYRRMVRKDRRALDDVIKNLQPGPLNNIYTNCHNCLEGPRVQYTIPWINQTAMFLYSSDEPEIPDEQ